VHSYVPSSSIIQALLHFRDLYRQVRPANERELRAHERLEAATRDLLSNLPRTNEHPTLTMLLEIAEIYSLTLEGVHRLFGYEIGKFGEYDSALNGGRTHIFESYPFKRDLPIDLPARLAPGQSFAIDAVLRDLVLEWQTDIPIRALEAEGWEEPGAFYVRVGTADSRGSSIPPGAIATVEPIGDAERALPNPRFIYLLQFGNGYRCSHCVLAGGRLRLFSTSKTYLGREDFAYPGSVRIAGRIRMFALSLPLQEQSAPAPLPHRGRAAELILPWEHHTRDRLFLTKHRRFRRPREEEILVHEILKELLNSKLSGRSERRYRRPTSSNPHVNSLIHLALAHTARYTDVLRSGGSWQSDQGRFSLEKLLEAKFLFEAYPARIDLRTPTPIDVWQARRNEFAGWPPLLSVKFPRLQRWEDRIVRLARECQIAGLDPTLRPGSLLLLEDVSSDPDVRTERTKFGWSRPIYVFRRGLDIACGLLERDGNDFALFSGADGRAKTAFHREDLSQLSRIVGVAVPV
jgi:hypothetical protein